MGEYALIFVMDVIITSLCMFVATKLSFVQAELKLLLGIVFVVAIVSLIPSIGWILGLVLFVYLLTKITDANLVDCIWVVAFTKLITFSTLFIFSSAFV
jgi:hypothetical protein